MVTMTVAQRLELSHLLLTKARAKQSASDVRGFLVLFVMLDGTDVWPM